MTSTLGAAGNLSPVFMGLMLVLFVLSFVVQAWLKNVYGKYSQLRNARNMTGAEVARRMLDDAGLQHVPVEMTPGKLSDHYDPIKKVVRLSEDNYNMPSIAGAAVAAHEVGHAIQDKVSMPALVLRQRMFPLLAFGSNFAPWLILAGIFLNATGLLGIGIVLFSLSVLFHLITLPVEFDASRRGLAYLTANGIVDSSQTPGATKVLNAAAMTYIMGFLVSLATLLYYLSIFLGRRD